MSTIRLRNVLMVMHRRLKDLAAEAGMLLSDYLIAELADREMLAGLRERHQAVDERKVAVDAASVIRKKG